MNQTTDQVEKKQLRLLKIGAWFVMGVWPILWLMGARLLISWGMKSKAGHEMLLYLFFIVALIVPAFGHLITRTAIGNYIKGTSASKTPAHLFLSIGVFQMFMVQIIYFLSAFSFMFSGEIQKMLYFYPISLVWSLVCWPTQRKYNQLLKRLNYPKTR